MLQWFRGLLTEETDELASLMGLDPNAIKISAAPPCANENIYNCPSRRIEFSAAAVAQTPASMTPANTIVEQAQEQARETRLQPPMPMRNTIRTAPTFCTSAGERP
jgi:hypothetical protein